MQGSKPDLGFDVRALPILVAIARGALATGEVSHAVQMANSPVRRYLHALQDAGFIIQRWDKKWVVVVRLAAVKVPGTPGEVVYEPPPDAYEAAVATQPVPPAPTPTEGPAALPRGILAPRVYTVAPAKGVPTVSATAKLASKRLNLPVWIKHRGEVGVGQKLEACEGCKRPTPVRYGTHVVCPVCARKTVEA